MKRYLLKRLRNLRPLFVIFGALLPLSVVYISGIFSVNLPAYAATGNSGNSGVSVNVSPNDVLASVPSTAFGVNTAVYDGYLTSSGIPNLLRTAGVDMLRYPGGSTSDVYNWETNTTYDGMSYANPENNFANFMKIAQASNAQPIITANYGTGTPALAAAWVKYANVTNNYNVNYWEIGNEVYGDGVYGANWEEDLNTPLGPQTYGTRALAYIQAMKAVDPNIQVGVVLTTPGGYGDGTILPGQTMDWNQTVLSDVGAEANFVIIHWYPYSSSVPSLFANLSSIPSMVASVRTQLVKYDGATLGNKIKIFVTETDSGYEDGSIQAGVFAPLDELGWIQAGASNVDWWDLHNGAGTATTDLNGQSDLNDQGILSNATCTGSVCEPAANTPFPTYYGIEMLKDFTSSGDSLVSVTSSQTNLAAYASVGSSGNESVLLANEGGTPYTVNLSNSGTALSGNATIYSYDGTGGITQTTGPANSVSVPAYSLVVVSLGTNSSSTTTTTTPSTPLQFTSVPYLNPVSCGVTISVGSQWAGGFTATVTLDNTVATTSSLAPWVWLYSWDLSWTWPAGQ
ncbi:MAG: cellulose-binding protein, partial [Firmicutes bacterium]|nr:cellulose-binding protein [Bacillota bacterium]